MTFNQRWAAFATAAALALTGCAAGGPDTTVPGAGGMPSPRPSVAPGTTAPYNSTDLIPPICDDLRAAVGYQVPVETIPSDGLPPGATAVWLCGEPGPPYGGRLGAHEPLTTDVEGFVDFLNALPKSDENLACTAEYGLSYLFVIEYPDGTTVPLEGGLHGCRTVGGREGADEAWAEITDRWAAQRAARDHTYTGTPELCGTSYREAEGIQNGLQSVWPNVGADAVRGVVCGLPAEAASYEDEVLQRDLPAEVVADLAEALSGEPVEGPGWADALLPYLVLLNQHGDPTTLLIQPDGQVVSDGEQFALTDALRARVLAEAEGFRTERFAQIPELCGAAYDAARAAFADVTGGVVCISQYDVPELGPELSAELAVDIARGFDAEAKPHTGDFYGYSVVLTDGKGASILLEMGSGGELVDGTTNRSWTIPDDIQAELAKRGFVAPKE